MISYIIACQSMTYAQKAAKILENSGITAYITRLPEQYTGNGGCSYGVKIYSKWLTQALTSLKSHNINPIKILMKTDDGKYSEVHI